MRHLWENSGVHQQDGSLVPCQLFRFATIGLSSGETIRLYSDLDALAERN